MNVHPLRIKFHAYAHMHISHYTTTQHLKQPNIFPQRILGILYNITAGVRNVLLKRRDVMVSWLKKENHARTSQWYGSLFRLGRVIRSLRVPYTGKPRVNSRFPRAVLQFQILRPMSNKNLYPLKMSIGTRHLMISRLQPFVLFSKIF